MRHVTAIILIAACETSEAPRTQLGCQVDLSGNFNESTSTVASCARLAAGAGATDGDTLLQLTVPSPMLGADFTISLDLGRNPTEGSYSAETSTLWSASGVKMVAPAGACLFIAGNSSTPTGDFMLELDSVDAVTAHGVLALTLAVLPRVDDDGTQTDCGAGTVEQAGIAF